MNKITLPKIVSRQEWRAERKELLQKEKQYTKARDELNTRRRMLPMVNIKKNYRFTGPGGHYSLLDIFQGRPQLIVYHFMFDPSWDQGCSSCTAWADHVSRGLIHHLHGRGTSLVLISRAPIAKIESFKKRMKWDIPWYSSYESDFNYDFHVTQDENVAPVEYNYRDQPTLEHLGQHYHTKGEQPGISCFIQLDDKVYHTYSTYGRGTESVGGANYFLDLTVLGRQEDWEEPKGRDTGLGAKAGSEKIMYPDEYDINSNK